MFQADEAELTLFGEVVVKLFALYVLFYYIFSNLMHTLVQHNLSQLFHPDKNIPLNQLFLSVSTSLLPIILAVTLLCWGRQIARWLFPTDAAVDLEQINSKYIISLLLLTISVYFIFTGGAIVIERLVGMIIYDQESKYVLISRYSGGLINGSLKLIFAFFLLLYIKPAATWLNSRIMGSVAGEKKGDMA